MGRYQNFGLTHARQNACIHHSQIDGGGAAVGAQGEAGPGRAGRLRIPGLRDRRRAAKGTIHQGRFSHFWTPPFPRVIRTTYQQGWGGPAVQYRQYTPVPANFGLVSDWRSNLGCSVLDWECQSLHLGNDPVHPDCRSFYFLARYIAYLTNKVALRAKI